MKQEKYNKNNKERALCYYKKNQEKILKRTAAYYKENREKILKRAAAYQKNNRERLIQKSRAYHKKRSKALSIKRNAGIKNLESWYVKQKIKRMFGIEYKDMIPEDILIKREQMQTKRILKRIRKELAL